MTRLLLIHGSLIPHYRVPIYGYLRTYLERYGYDFTVAAEGIQQDNPHILEFPYLQMPLSVPNIVQLVYRQQFDIIIMFVNLRHHYLFPTYLIAKGFLRRKMIYWGQGRDLSDTQALIKNLAFAIEHAICDAIILYAEHLKKYIAQPFHKKVFVANNTLFINYRGLPAAAREKVLIANGIHTRKNIICAGRIQKRKRLEHLVAAHAHINRADIGLILVGPDPHGILNAVQGINVYKLCPVYGSRLLDLLSASDVYCLPGAVGLSIVDAFHCGLPFVTEEGDESAEIMYLRNEHNGFVVSRGNISDMAHKLLLLLDDDALRQRFSSQAKRDIATNGSIDKLAAGFRDALLYVCHRSMDNPESSNQLPPPEGVV